jgi:hypothetical protein
VNEVFKLQNPEDEGSEFHINISDCSYVTADTGRNPRSLESTAASL